MTYSSLERIAFILEINTLKKDGCLAIRGPQNQTSGVFRIGDCVIDASRLHLIFTSSSPHLHLIFTSSSPHLHLIFTSSSPHLHLIFTSSSPHLHLIFTSSSPHLHLIFTSSSITPM
ncbi:uncharacterized protein N7511_011352 [Penicillium nucicola]|uniref:uncharacterized protein n=1 Tax=Penicillium nucicola TaxID=1850975 RepID=UPI002544F4A2|nr:uncharacterized protein N7511_011352 [Penicillium nucicola]KAJ5742620.1 hypothetical protein N7511_011352 [Penicillium nucicola]